MLLMPVANNALLILPDLPPLRLCQYPDGHFCKRSLLYMYDHMSTSVLCLRSTVFDFR